MNESEWIGNASLDQLKAGYVETAERYTCLCCGESFEKGIIYPEGGLLYDAGRYTRLHIEQAHGSVFEHLIHLDKSVTGLSDVQRRLLALFYQGDSDVAVQKALGIGSTSTIRNHRFLLREKERQARVFLAIMELLRSRGSQVTAEAAPLTPGGRDGAGAAGEREKVIKKYFPHGSAGPLKSLPVKEKLKRIVVGEVARRFEAGRIYTGSEVDQVLEGVLPDYVTLRRHLVDYGLLSRLPDGSQYWLSDATEERKESNMGRREELKRLAKEAKTEAGVMQIKNNRTGKVFVHVTPNLKTINGHQFSLETDGHPNRELQADWNRFGKEAFTIEVLEVLKQPETGYFDLRGELKKLKAKWLEQLQPFGERGYNSPKEVE